MKRFCTALLHSVLVLLLVYFTIGLGWTVLVLPSKFDRQTALLPTTLGFAAGLGFFVFVARFLALYVLGHEFTHWLTAKCFLRRTGNFRVGLTAGSVEVEHPNIWIVLAPYFVPVYSLLWIGLWGIYRLWRGAAVGMMDLQIFHAGLGFSYAFHVVLTVHAVLREQQDLRAYGRCLSLALIACANVGLFFVALATAGDQWPAGIALLRHHLIIEWEILVWAGNALAAVPGRIGG